MAAMIFGHGILYARVGACRQREALRERHIKIGVLWTRLNVHGFTFSIVVGFILLCAQQVVACAALFAPRSMRNCKLRFDRWPPVRRDGERRCRAPVSCGQI